jgi:ABC-type lipoprotein export system ATPase subunit
MIEARELTKRYGTGTAAVTALADVNFTVQAGECVGLLGRSGSGKSTLMNLLGGLDQPTSGSLTVHGHNLGSLNRAALADYRLSTVGFVFQAFHLIHSKTVFENVELPLVLARVPKAERKAKVAAALEAVRLTARDTHTPTQLSGGERQRTAVARAIVNQPRLLLADEPTGNLDSASAKDVMDLLMEQVRANGTTLLLVTHDEELAKRYTPRVLRMADGQMM